MVRNYKKTSGTRAYKNYADNDLKAALQKVTDGELSIHAASIQYKIPLGTLYNRYKRLHTRTVGGQTSFTHVEEKALLRAAATCADWGFPLTALDLRMIAKAYLSKYALAFHIFHDVERAGPSHENENEDESDTNQCEGPEVGNFILAKFPSAKGKKTYKYVCLIEDVSENKIVVKGLKSVKKDKKKFRVVEDDISIIEITDVIMYLPQPEFKRNVYVFPADINVVEL